MPIAARRAAPPSRRPSPSSAPRYIEDRLFKTILPPEEVAAIILEPIQGEGGYVVAPDNFLQEIRRICDRHGILLIADEVQSGAGRTGKWWAIEHSGVQPDIVCIAKGIASGMPLGICMAKAEIMNWVPGSHASTFGGNPVCIAAGLATMDVLEREGIKNAAAVGGKMLERLQLWVARHPTVGDVRGRGLMIGIEIVKDQKSRTPAGPMRDRSSRWPSSAASSSSAAARPASASVRRSSSSSKRPTSLSTSLRSASNSHPMAKPGGNRAAQVHLAARLAHSAEVPLRARLFLSHGRLNW